MFTTQITAADPVCGMTVDPGDSLRSEHEGKSYFFCSAGCKRKFEDDPAGVLAARAKKDALKNQASNDEASCCCSGKAGRSAAKANDSPADPNWTAPGLAWRFDLNRFAHKVYRP